MLLRDGVLIDYYFPATCRLSYGVIVNSALFRRHGDFRRMMAPKVTAKTLHRVFFRHVAPIERHAFIRQRQLAFATSSCVMKSLLSINFIQQFQAADDYLLYYFIRVRLNT